MSEKLPKGFRWVKVGEWLRANDSYWSELEDNWATRWSQRLSNYTLRPIKCCTRHAYIRNKKHPTHD